MGIYLAAVLVLSVILFSAVVSGCSGLQYAASGEAEIHNHENGSGQPETPKPVDQPVDPFIG
jgi:hypothetical protein